MVARRFGIAMVTIVAVVATSGCAYVMRASVSSQGAQGNGQSETSALSGDGRFLAFASRAANLVAGDTNGQEDVFLRDLAAGTTTRISVATDGTQSNGQSLVDDISGDGRYIVFVSSASNLVPDDTNGTDDIFVRDVVNDTTTRVSVATDGGQANGASLNARIDSFGTEVAFQSSANNLVAGDTNGVDDVFVRFLGDEEHAAFTEAASFDANGRPRAGASEWPAISANGQFVGFATTNSLVLFDTDGVEDVYLRNLLSTPALTWISVPNAGGQPNGTSYSPALSNDGRYVAFTSVASNLVPNDTNGWHDVFVRDRVAGTTERVSTGSNGAQGNLLSLVPRISDDGRFVAFESGASNLVAADNNGALDVFTKDRASNLTYLDSTDASLHAANSNSDTPDLSGDGRYVSFDSTATNLVGDDNNGLQDLFVHAATRPTVTSVSPADLARGFSGTVTITGAGFRSGLVEADFGPGISVGSNGNHVVTWVNDNQLSANVSVSTNAPTGSHSVGVFNAGTGPGPGAGAGGDCLCANVH